MSFGNHTPETLLARSDSKDPATTCKGITTAGRPCRRALAASASASPAASPSTKGNGVVAVLNEGDAAAFFCWQHKDQVEQLLAKFSQHTRVIPLKEKSSIDTLMERIGVLEINDDEVGDREAYLPAQKDTYRTRERHRPYEQSRTRSTLPQEWQRIQGPLMSLPRDIVESQGTGRPRERREIRPRPTLDRAGQSKGKASWGCCTRTDDYDDLPPPRRRDDRHQRSRTHEGRGMSQVRSSSRSRYSRHAEQNSYGRSSPTKDWDRTEQDRRAARQRSHTRTSSNQLDARSERPTQVSSYTAAPRLPSDEVSEMQQYRSPQAHDTRAASSSGHLGYTPTKPQVKSQMPASPPNPQTVAFLSLIPSHLSPATTSALLSELSKPISQADEEGYIYIFWLTPESDTSKPDAETAESILDPDEFSPDPSPTKSGPSSTRNRRKSEVDRRQASNLLTTQALQRFASVRHSSAEPNKILLKIGRANNVYRRLSQWTKQCGQNITLVRYYPYQARHLDHNHIQKEPVPHVHRVERLIHLELADQRVANKGKCEQCGREHKEWFEIEATKGGVRAVDEVVRRWVGWAQTR